VQPEAIFALISNFIFVMELVLMCLLIGKEAVITAGTELQRRMRNKRKVTGTHWDKNRRVQLRRSQSFEILFGLEWD
jgi:hypothetical protein